MSTNKLRIDFTELQQIEKTDHAEKNERNLYFSKKIGKISGRWQLEQATSWRLSTNMEALEICVIRVRDPRHPGLHTDKKYKMYVYVPTIQTCASHTNALEARTYMRASWKLS